MADESRIQKILEIKISASQAIDGIAALNQQIDQNKAKMKELATQGGKNSHEYAILGERTKALTNEKRLLQKEVQNEVKQQTELDGSLRQLRAELSTLTQQYDKLSRAERENMAVGGKLQKQINQVTTEIKNAEEGTQRYYRNVGNYRNSILEAVGINSRFGGSLVSIVNAQGGVSGAFAAMGSSVKAFGSALWSLMANPVFLALAGIVGAGMAFKWFYDYNVAVEKATRLTREFTGVTGAELTHLRAEIQATASTYNKDFKEVLESVDLLMSHFNITSSEAIDTINKGFAVGADINGNYLDLLKQYGPVFKDAGFSAEQLVALIQQTRSGIFSQQGLEAIKQASARIREMSSGTRNSLQAIGIDVDDMQRKLVTRQMDMADAIKMVSDRLKELPSNSQEVGNVMADVFGRQGKFASQEMIESLGEIDTNLDHLIEKAGEYGKALSDNQKATADLEEESAKLFRTGEGGWETMKTRADTLWKSTLANILKRMRELLVWFAKMGRQSQVFRVTAQVIAGVIGESIGQIVDLFRGLGTGFKAMGAWVDAFVNTFKNAFLVIRDLGYGVGAILTGKVSEGIDHITAGLNKGVNNTLRSINTALATTAAATYRATTGFRNLYNTTGQFFDTYGLFAEYDLTDRVEGVVNNKGNGDKGNGDKGSGGSSSGGSSSGGTSSGDKTATDKAADELAKRTADLIKKGEALQQKALEEAAKDSEDGITKLAEAQKAAFLRVYGEREQYSGEALAAYDQLLQDIDKKADEARKKLQDKQAKEREQQQRTAREEAKKLVQAMMDGQTDGSAEELKYRLWLLDMQMQAELAEYEDNESMKTAITQKYAKQRTDILVEQAKKQHEIEIARLQAGQNMVGALAELSETIGEDNKAAAALAKVLAVGEVMLAQAVAIANAIETSSKAPNPWLMIAQIAMSVTAVTSAMAQAFKSLDAAKFATGGYVRGAGTGTSDSIPARLSNGESVMNANTTAMFGGLLSSLNQLGGGVPIQVQQTATSVRGEDMLARAVARGVAMLPAPVVSVEDINRGQRQVEVLNQRVTL